MTTQATMRTNIRRDLRDEDAANYKWTDAEVDRAIARALADYNLACPGEEGHIIAAVADTRTYLLTEHPELLNCLAVRRVEYPADQYPRAFVPFEVDANRYLTLLVDPPPQAGNNLRVWADIPWVISAGSCNIREEHAAIVEGGAAGYLAEAWAIYAVNRVNTSTLTVQQYQALAQDRLRQFRAALRRLERARAQLADQIATLAGYEI